MSLSIPVLGFAPDAASRSLRAMLGAPASLIWGAPLELGLAIERAAVSPSQEYALAALADDPRLVLIRLGPEARAPLIIEGLTFGDGRVVFSPAGKSAAFVSRGGARIMTGLPDAPAASFDCDLTGFSEGVVAFAISDDGRFALAGVSGGSLWVFAQDREPRSIAALMNPSAVSFIPGTHDAVAADRATNTVYLIRDVPGSAQVMQVASQQDGIDNPVAVEVSADRKQIVIANNPGSIVYLTPDNAGARTLACECVVDGLFRMQGNAVFRLTRPDAGPSSIFDGDSEEPRILRAPPIPDAGSKVLEVEP